MVKSFTEYVHKNCVSSEYERELLKHGIQIILNDGLNIITVLLICRFLHADIVGYCYIISFALLRRYSGGWHAPTHFTCFITYQSLFLITLGFSSMEINIMTKSVIFILFSVLTGVMGPVAHWLNPLTEPERSKNHHRLVRNLVILNIIYLVFSLNKSSTLCNVMLSSLSLNYACMILLQYLKKRRKI